MCENPGVLFLAFFFFNLFPQNAEETISEFFLGHFILGEENKNEIF